MIFLEFTIDWILLLRLYSLCIFYDDARTLALLNKRSLRESWNFSNFQIPIYLFNDCEYYRCIIDDITDFKYLWHNRGKWVTETTDCQNINLFIHAYWFIYKIQFKLFTWYMPTYLHVWNFNYFVLCIISELNEYLFRTPIDFLWHMFQF